MRYISSFSVSTSKSTPALPSSYQPFSEKTAATVYPSSAYSLSSKVQYSIPTSSRTPPSLKPPAQSSTSSVSSYRLLDSVHKGWISHQGIIEQWKTLQKHILVVYFTALGIKLEKWVFTGLIPVFD